MALRIGSRGPSLKIRATRKLLGATRCRVDSLLEAIDGQAMLFEAFPVQCTTNSELERAAAIPLFIEKQSIVMAWNGVDTM